MDKVEINREELVDLLQKTGDGIADLFKQYMKGNWVDDHGHDVGMNIAMQNLKVVLVGLMGYRWKNLNYSKPEL